MKINFLKNLFCIKCKGFVNVEKILEGVILFYLFFYFFFFLQNYCKESNNLFLIFPTKQ